MDGTQLRDSAIEVGLANANAQWRTQALLAVMAIALQKDRFTTDDVWEQIEALETASPRTHDNRAMGGIMKKAQKLGLIVPTDDHQLSTRAVCHRRPLRVWQSTRRH